MKNLFEYVRMLSNGDLLVYDRETKVMYIKSKNNLTVLLNADGTPKLYKKGSKKYANT